MRTHRKRRADLGKACALALAFVGMPAAFASDESSTIASTELASKLMLRMSSGIVGNFGVGWEKPLTPKFSFGIDYRVESDASAIVRGFDFFARYYPLGSGTRMMRRSSARHEILSQRSWSPYLGAEGLTREYGVQRSGATSSGSATGSLAGFNGLVGVNLRVASSLEVGAELALNLITSFQTDDQVKPQSMVYILTLNYLY